MRRRGLRRLHAGDGFDRQIVAVDRVPFPRLPRSIPEINALTGMSCEGGILCGDRYGPLQLPSLTRWSSTTYGDRRSPIASCGVRVAAGDGSFTPDYTSGDISLWPVTGSFGLLLFVLHNTYDVGTNRFLMQNVNAGTEVPYESANWRADTSAW